MLFLSSADMRLAGDSQAWPYCSAEFAILQVGDAHAFPFSEVCTPWFEGPYVSAKTLRHSALAHVAPSSLLVQEAQTQTLHSAHRPLLASCTGWDPKIPFSCSLLLFLASWVQWAQTTLSIWPLCWQGSCVYTQGP